MVRKSWLLGGLVAAVLVVGAHPAHALTVFVERLTYTENGSIAFQDEFNDPLSVPARKPDSPLPHSRGIALRERFDEVSNLCLGRCRMEPMLVYLVRRNAQRNVFRNCGIG